MYPYFNYGFYKANTRQAYRLSLITNADKLYRRLLSAAAFENRSRASTFLSKRNVPLHVPFFCMTFLVCFFHREFYYIQMEKYARQAISEGISNVEDLHVSPDSELFRVLNLHYNRNNQIEVSFVLIRTSRPFKSRLCLLKSDSYRPFVYSILPSRL